ncbi:hypothetical protein LY78DRAFT_659333 [Colletotrichum sublineola]|nr:hypothetical protein LY78DRAFT_659333 [Colletotrichum sublineola]
MHSDDLHDSSDRPKKGDGFHFRYPDNDNNNGPRRHTHVTAFWAPILFLFCLLRLCGP